MKILNTKEYDQFKTIPGNRPINMRHVNHLVEMNSKENLMWMFPGTITKDGYLFDGQHRLEACEANEWDFYYVVSDKTLAELGEPIVALTNTAQLKWGIPDFIHYYTAHGKEQYIFLTQLMETYHLQQTIVLVLVSGASQARALKRGELKIFTNEEDKQVCIDILDGYGVLCDVVPHDIWISAPFALAIRIAFGIMSAEELKSEIIRSNAHFERQVNSSEYLRFLENKVVNFRKSEKNWIRFF